MTIINKPYVYRLTYKTTGDYYYGYREDNKLPAIEDLPIYQSSSDIIKEKNREMKFCKKGVC